MSYCPECGEEVAEIDSFCPHCGITLQPMVVESASSDESLESTIVISHEELAEQVRSQAAETASEIESSSPKVDAVTSEMPLESDDASEPVTGVALAAAETPVPERQEESDQSDLGADTSGENEFAESEADVLNSEVPDEVPDELPQDEISEEIAEGRLMTDGEIADQPTIDKVLFDEESLPVINDQSDYFNETAATSGDQFDDDTSLTEAAMEDFVSVPESGTVDAVESESTQVDTEDKDLTGAAVATPEKADEMSGSVGEGPEDILSSTISESPEPDSDKFSEASEASTIIKSTGPVGRKTFQGDQPPDEKKLAASSIGKPDFEFEEEDSSPGVSKFDSVSIREKNDDAAEESLDETLIGAFPGGPAPAVSVTESASSEPVLQDQQESDKESRSYTSPNMGGSDTDGKKSKLKPLDEGTILNNRYEIVRKIGGGGMGAVYLASDKNLGGVLRAVKEMVQSYIEEEQQEKAVNDFKRESMLLTSLEHSSIPTIYDYFFDDKEARFYLVMKYINGGDLSSRLRSAPEGRIDERSVVEWAIQVADVLDYLHRREPPIVYRDLKPSNIMIDGNSGKVMLIDFGIARWINKEEKGVTAVGTMGYAPPELFSGNVEPRSDIYSLGSTMFHLLTGADPQSNPLLIFDFQKNPRPRQINPQLSDQIESILMTSVEYNADKRFASTGHLRRALEEHLSNLDGSNVTFGVKESPKSVTLSDEKVFCGFCGQGIVASDLFCAFCGAKQPIAQKGVHGESYSSVPVTARLSIIGTSDLESPSYLIDKDENLVGRRDPMSNIFPEVDLSKYDPQTKISRRHARIWRDGNKFLVEDLGSSNGTILLPVINDPFRLVPNQPHLLANGDRLKLGDTTLHFVIG